MYQDTHWVTTIYAKHLGMLPVEGFERHGSTRVVGAAVRQDFARISSQRQTTTPFRQICCESLRQRVPVRKKASLCSESVFFVLFMGLAKA